MGLHLEFGNVGHVIAVCELVWCMGDDNTRKNALGWNIIHGLFPFFRPIQFTDFSRFLDQFIYSMTFQGPGSHFLNFHDFSRIPGPLGTLYSPQNQHINSVTFTNVASL